MGLPELWFVIIAVLWTGFFFLEGFDFGVGMMPANKRLGSPTGGSPIRSRRSTPSSSSRSRRAW
jgi:hypothetical protein